VWTLSGEYLAVHTEDPADGPSRHADMPGRKPHHSTGLTPRHLVALDQSTGAGAQTRAGMRYQLTERVAEGRRPSAGRCEKGPGGRGRDAASPEPHALEVI
jgi:hypothetical protein